ncbi:TPA: T9SS type A sorting domain-containing protein, partial [Candidatus Poribacteria bacterium]|nr:T9SS type A sorting domain-containing protein [Candidatus Poribacteria bacterium]
LNKVTSFTRSASQLQSAISKPQRIYFDQVKPEVEFVDLPTHVSRSPFKVRVRYGDNSGGPAGSVTLFVNGKAQAVSTETALTTVEVKLKVGDNLLVVSAVDLAGNVSQPLQKQLVLDDKAPETTPANLSMVLSFSGREVSLSWSVDVNAGSYNLYRSEMPIDQVDAKQRLVENLSVPEYRDVDINVGSTYYYSVTSVSPAGLESQKVSVNLNLTVLLASAGGTTVLADGGRLTAVAGALTLDPTLYTAISIQRPAEADLPDLSGAIEGTGRRFAALMQNGSLFESEFLSAVDISIPYPASEIPESLKMFVLEGDEWKLVEGVEINAAAKTLNLKANRFNTYRLMLPQSKPWDLNGDGKIDILDLSIVGRYLGQTGEKIKGDADENGLVDLFDLVTVVTHYGQSYDLLAAAPMVVMGQSRGKVSMHVSHSTDHRGGLQTQQLDLQVKADIPESIAGYQLELVYNPRLLTVVGFEKGSLLGAESYHLQPQMTLGCIGRIVATQLGESTGLGAAESVMASVSFRLKGDLDLALKSIGIRNLVIANQQSQSLPVELERMTTNLETTPMVRFSLGQNYPNPFNPETWIPYQLASSEQVVIQIYDASGHLARRIDVGLQSAGDYTGRGGAVYWDGRNQFGEQVASGVYYYTIDAGDFSATSKMLLLK